MREVDRLRQEALIALHRAQAGQQAPAVVQHRIIAPNSVQTPVPQTPIDPKALLIRQAQIQAYQSQLAAIQQAQLQQRAQLAALQMQ